MAADEQPVPGTIAAGDFSAWLASIDAARSGTQGSEVPCGSCTACCASGQFVHIGPDETAALAHIPAELLFPAPRLPEGHVLLGYDEHGRCPMLVDDACSIYEHRPNACRTYDCRVFAATGIDPDPDKPLIADRVRRWRFSFATLRDREAFDALHTVAARLDEDRSGQSTVNATQRALTAIEVSVRIGIKSD